MKNFVTFIICLVDTGIQKLWPFPINDLFTHILLIFYRKKLAQYNELSCIYINGSFWSDFTLQQID